MSHNESSYKEDNTGAMLIYFFIPCCVFIFVCCKTIRNFYLDCIYDEDDFISASEYETETEGESEGENEWEGEVGLEENSTRELKPDYDSADSDESKYQ
jgi:hypothetical protein